MIEWKRAVKDQTEISDRRRWRSRCGTYEVVESIPRYSGLTPKYYAVLLPCTMLKRANTKAAAERACERHANPPKKRKRKS